MSEQKQIHLAYDQTTTGQLILTVDSHQVAQFNDQEPVIDLIDVLNQLMTDQGISALIIHTGEQASGVVEGIYLALRSGALAIRKTYQLQRELSYPQEVESWSALPQEGLLKTFMVLAKAVARSSESGALSLELTYLFNPPEAIAQYSN